MTMNKVSDALSFYQLQQLNNRSAHSTQSTQNQENASDLNLSTTASTDSVTSYRYAEPLRTLAPRQYSSIYTRDDVSAQGTVGTPTDSNMVLEDFSVSSKEASVTGSDSSSITDKEMDSFLKKAFKLFDFKQTIHAKEGIIMLAWIILVMTESTVIVGSIFYLNFYPLLFLL